KLTQLKQLLPLVAKLILLRIGEGLLLHRYICRGGRMCFICYGWYFGSAHNFFAVSVAPAATAAPDPPPDLRRRHIHLQSGFDDCCGRHGGSSLGCTGRWFQGGWSSRPDRSSAAVKDGYLSLFRSLRAGEVHAEDLRAGPRFAGTILPDQSFEA